MFDTLFRYPAIVARHQGARFAAARELFLNHCAGQGMAHATLQRYAQELLVVAERIDITVGEAIESSVIGAAAGHWAREQHQRQRVGGLRWSRELFVQTATDWLRFLGRLEGPKPKNVPFADRIADFAAHRRDEPGLSPATVRNQSWHVEKFLNWLGEQNCSFDNVSLENVDAFLAANGKQGWGRVSVATSAKALRAFFKHAAVRGWCTAGIAVGIDGPRLFRHEGLPVGPSWPDVRRLIASTGGDSARDIRDRAILILLATYGLRSGEVSGLRLEDVNWESEKVSIMRPKQRRAQEYPLVNEAGEAILNYLQKARPRCAQREVFLTSKAPFHRLSQGAVYHPGQHTPERARNPRATPWAALSTPCLCRPSGGGGIFVKGDWRSPRAPQRFCHSYLRQSGSGRITRGSEFRSGRSAMKLSALASQYVSYKQGMGMRFHTEARTMHSFCRSMGDIDMAAITAGPVHAYIAGTGPITRFWHRKYEVLRGFYRFATARGHVDRSPLPTIIPKAPEFLPHLFSHEELQRLLDASADCENPRSKLQPHTWRMLILLLYGAALRISEALSLTLADVDLPAGILTIRESKFYKTRLVPMSPDLSGVLETYVARRAKEYSTKPDAALFLTRNGTPLARYTAENVFRRLRVRAGVLRPDGGRYQPRLHDLRHAAAVHRLISWYRQGADVQRLLPQLATYLGHVNIAATQRYLTMTPELLHEASQRFERYACGGQNE